MGAAPIRGNDPTRDIGVALRTLGSPLLFSTHRHQPCTFARFFLFSFSENIWCGDVTECPRCEMKRKYLRPYHRITHIEVTLFFKLFLSNNSDITRKSREFATNSDFSSASHRVFRHCLLPCCSLFPLTITRNKITTDNDKL